MPVRKIQIPAKKFDRRQRLKWYVKNLAEAKAQYVFLARHNNPRSMRSFNARLKWLEGGLSEAAKSKNIDHLVKDRIKQNVRRIARESLARAYSIMHRNFVGASRMVDRIIQAVAGADDKHEVTKLLKEVKGKGFDPEFLD